MKFFLLFLLSMGLAAQDQPELLVRYLTGGKIIGSPVFSPRNEVFAASEDQFIYFLNETGIFQSRFSLGKRLHFGIVHGSGNWLSVITRDRKLHRLDYVPGNTRTPGQISLAWSVSFPEEPASPPVLLPGARLALGFRNGSIRVWESDGALAWSHQDQLPPSDGALACDPSGKLWWAAGTSLRIFSQRGEVLGETRLPEPINRMVLDTHGRAWMFSESQRLFRVNRPGGPLVPLNYQTPLQFLGREDGGGWILFPRSVKSYDINSRQVSEVNLTQNLLAGGVFSGNGSLALPLSGGGLWVKHPDQEPFKIPVPELGILSLSPGGTIAGGGADWAIYLFSFLPPPVLGWYQESGSSDSSRRVRMNLEALEQRERWEGFNGFQISRILLNMGGRNDHVHVLENLEAAAKAGQIDTIPYASGLLVEICQSGIERLQMENFQLINNWPDLRLRAVTLLTELGDFDTRETLWGLLKLENASVVRIAIVKFQEKLAWDGDSLGATTLADLLQTRGTEYLAEPALSYLETLKRAGGIPKSSEHARLIRLLLQGNYPRQVRERAWSLMR